MNRTNHNWPTVAYMETDRFCTECAYNLRQQTVIRHPDLDILLCRCPECGRHHAASESTTIGNLWLRRVGRFALIVWVVGLLVAVLSLAAAESGLMASTLEELVGRQWQPGSHGKYIMVVRPYHPDKFTFVAFLRLLSLVTGALLGAGAVTLSYHWRRRKYFLLVVLVPCLAGAAVFSYWLVEAENLTLFGLKIILGHAALCILGGVLGIICGRPLARAAIRAVLPPRFWPVLCDLWLVDEKPLPQPRKAKAP